MTGNRRRGVLAAFLAWAVVVGTLTLTPAGAPGTPTLEEFLCWWCADRATADMILNWLLFLPGGALLSALVGRPRAILVGVLATVAIESLQTFIPGRWPSLPDMILNTAGMAAGAWWRFWPLPFRTARVLALAATLAWLAPAFLLLPRPTDGRQFGLWTPRFGDMAHYQGSVVSAFVGDVPARWGPFRDRSGDVRDALGGRSAVEVRFVVGRDPGAVAPVFAVFDSEQQENLIVGAVGDALLLRVRTVARTIRLDQPDGRWDGALRGHAPGDTVVAILEPGRGDLCITVSDTERCGLAPAPGDGSAFLMNLDGASPAARALVAGLWSLALGGLLGLAFRGPGPASAIGAALGLTGWAVAAWSPDMAPSVLHSLLFVAGAAAAGGIRAVEARRRGSGGQAVSQATLKT